MGVYMRIKLAFLALDRLSCPMNINELLFSIKFEKNIAVKRILILREIAIFTMHIKKYLFAF